MDANISCVVIWLNHVGLHVATVEKPSVTMILKHIPGLELHCISWCSSRAHCVNVNFAKVGTYGAASLQPGRHAQGSRWRQERGSFREAARPPFPGRWRAVPGWGPRPAVRVAAWKLASD